MRHTTIRYNLTAFDLSKKARPPPGGDCGHEVILYDAGIADYTVQIALGVNVAPPPKKRTIDKSPLI